MFERKGAADSAIHHPPIEVGVFSPAARIKEWAGSSFAGLTLEGSFRLAYNGSIFTREGLGYLLTFDHLIDTSKGSGLTFRPLSPALETKLYIAWKRYQAFTPIAERFLKQLLLTFSPKSPEPPKKTDKQTKKAGV